MSRCRVNEGGITVFGLPLETSVIVFGFPLFWIIYTIVFLIRTKDWEREGNGDDTA